MGNARRARGHGAGDASRQSNLMDRGGDLDGRVEINVAFGSAGSNDTTSWLWRPDTIFAQPVEVERDGGLDPS
jgi:hypothetical protein